MTLEASQKGQDGEIWQNLGVEEEGAKEPRAPEAGMLGAGEEGKKELAVEANREP